MLLLTTVTEYIRITPTSAASIDAFASWVDAPIPATPSSNVTPGKQFIADHTTTSGLTLVSEPAASTARNVKQISIVNNHASSSTVLTVDWLQGTAPFSVVELAKVLLLAGESLRFSEDGTWTHQDSQGGVYNYSPSTTQNLGTTGVFAETMPRELCPEVNTVVGTTGVLYMQAIRLRAGDLVNSIDLWSSTTAAGTPTNYNAGLYDLNRSLLMGGTNKTTEAWAVNSLKTFALTSPYRIPTTGTYYIGFYMTATTVVTLKGGNARTGGQLNNAAPVTSGTSTTGLTTALPTNAAALGLVTSSIYAALR